MRSPHPVLAHRLERERMKLSCADGRRSYLTRALGFRPIRSTGGNGGLAGLATQAGNTGAHVLRRLAPYGLQMVVSAAAYSAGLGLFQVAGAILAKQRLASCSACACCELT